MVLIIFASGRVYFGFTFQLNVFGSSSHRSRRSLLGPSTCSFRYQAVGSSPPFSLGQKRWEASLCVSPRLRLSFCCNYTASSLRAALGHPAAGLLHASPFSIRLRRL